MEGDAARTRAAAVNKTRTSHETTKRFKPRKHEITKPSSSPCDGASSYLYFISCFRAFVAAFFVLRQIYLQTKFCSSSVLPAPLYCAFCGYVHSGRLRVTAPLAILRATRRCGAFPFSTQSAMAAGQSTLSGPVP